MVDPGMVHGVDPVWLHQVFTGVSVCLCACVLCERLACLLAVGDAIIPGVRCQSPLLSAFKITNVLLFTNLLLSYCCVQHQ